MRTLVRFLLWTLLIIGGILAVARVTAFRWFSLPTNDPILEASVLPTLAGGDLILTWRITKPAFGDLVVCPEPDYPSRYIIGRIVGEAGDNVTIKDGIPTTNGKAYRSERRCEPGTFTYPNPDNDAEEVTQECSWEAISNHLHKAGLVGSHKVRPKDISVDVPDGQLFLLSDNRLYPYDSRDFGLVERSSCKETIVARLVSKDGWMDAKKRLNYIQ